MQLDFFQRRIGVVTLLLVGVTLALALVLFTGEWSRTFWLELAMLIFAELVFGAAHMHVFGRDDTILPSRRRWGRSAQAISRSSC